MNCDDFLRHRSSVARRNPESWPQDLQLHLSSCSDCARLENYLGNAEAENIDLDEIDSRVQKLIAADLTPVTPLAPARQRVFTFTLIFTAAVTGIVWFLGGRGWTGMSSGRVYVTVGTLAVLLLIAASELSAQMVPGEKRRFRPLPLFGICLFSMPLIALLLFPATHDDEFAIHALRCWAIGTACALCTVPFLWLVLRRGFSLSPYIHLGSAGLLAGLTGIAVLELHCPIMDGLHKAIGHGAVVLTTAIMGGATGFVLKRR